MSEHTAENDRIDMDRERGQDDVIEVLRAAARHPHKGPEDTDASMLRAAAKRLNGGYEPGGSWTKQTVARLCETVASLIESRMTAENDALARVEVVLVERERFDGAVLANERYGEGFCDGWAAAVADVRATLAHVFPPGEGQSCS